MQKFKVADKDKFVANVFGSKRFLQRWPEIESDGIILEYDPTRRCYWIVDANNNRVGGDFAFFYSAEMQYLEPVTSVLVSPFTPPLGWHNHHIWGDKLPYCTLPFHVYLKTKGLSGPDVLDDFEQNYADFIALFEIEDKPEFKDFCADVNCHYYECNH